MKSIYVLCVVFFINNYLHALYKVLDISGTDSEFLCSRLPQKLAIKFVNKFNQCSKFGKVTLLTR